MFRDSESVTNDLNYSLCLQFIACSTLTFKPASVSFSLTECLDAWISYISI